MAEYGNQRMDGPWQKNRNEHWTIGRNDKYATMRDVHKQAMKGIAKKVAAKKIPSEKGKGYEAVSYDKTNKVYTVYGKHQVKPTAFEKSYRRKNS